MKNKPEKIDRLLIANAESQLGRVNWHSLNSSISESLDKVSDKHSARPRSYKLFAAAGVAAAVLLGVFILNLSYNRGPVIEPGQAAAVELSSSKAASTVIFDGQSSAASAIVELTPSSRGRAEVSFASETSRDVVCEIEIFDSNATMKKITDRPSWIIINVHKSSVAQGETQNDNEELFWMM